MDNAKGGLKDIFSTILTETQQVGTVPPQPQRIIIHGNGNVIAPGGTVHYTHSTPLPGPGDHAAG